MKSRLLLVDDKPENIIALQGVLGNDYVLYSAGSGLQALATLEHKDVDLVLLDIQMPDMDGYETARRIKKIPRCEDIPIIFITAVYREDAHIKMGYRVGAVDYFTKPFDPDILRTKIAMYSSFRQKHALLKEKERRLQESEELLQSGRKLSAVLESLPVGVAMADTEGRIIQTNDVVLKIWESGTAPERGAYGEFLEWWSQEGLPIKNSFATALTSGKATHNERMTIRCFNASAKTVLVSVSPLRGLANEIVGAVAVIQDITEHRRIEQDMEQRIMKLVSIGVELEQQSAIY